MKLNDKGIEAAFARFVDGDQHDNAAHFVAAIVTAYLEASQPTAAKCSPKSTRDGHSKTTSWSAVKGHSVSPSSSEGQRSIGNP